MNNHSNNNSKIVLTCVWHSSKHLTSLHSCSNSIRCRLILFSCVDEVFKAGKGSETCLASHNLQVRVRILTQGILCSSQRLEQYLFLELFGSGSWGAGTLSCSEYQPVDSILTCSWESWSLCLWRSHCQIEWTASVTQSHPGASCHWRIFKYSIPKFKASFSYIYSI